MRVAAPSTLVIASPVSPQAYSISGVPDGNCFMFGVLDQNHNGIVDADDMQNTDSDNDTFVTISGNQANLNITLPSANAIASLHTCHSRTVGQAGDWYGVSFRVKGQRQAARGRGADGWHEPVQPRGCSQVFGFQRL